MDLKSLVALFNTNAKIVFNRAYQSVEPEIKGLLYEYPSGPVEKVGFPFMGFLTGMAEFTGTSKFEELPDSDLFYVTNKEYQGGITIKAAELDRAANMTDPLAGLNLYTKKISELPQSAADHPYELALDMLEAGDAATYGTCFDGQNLFDTTHDYSTAAGKQNNIVTGGGVTAALIIADLSKAVAAMDGFTYAQGGTGNSKKRKLNRKVKLLAVCPTELSGVFRQIRTQANLASGETNPFLGLDYVSRPFTDTGDWYLLNIDQSDNLGLFLYQVEKPVELETPTVNDESYKNNKRFQWSAYGRYAVSFGAWWKGVMITNS